MLRVDRLSKAFGSTQAVDQVSFQAEPGRVLALIGENGSGKSTLMKLIAGETIADSGEISVRPEDVHLVHQELLLCPHLTAAENLFLGSSTGLLFSPRKLEHRAQELLDNLGFPEVSASQTTSDLPISQRQVIEIARAIVKNCPIILLDEPTSSLTEADKTKFYGLVRRLKDAGKTVIFISHFLEEVRAVSDDCVILRDGQMVASGLLSDLPDQEIVRHMVGREVTDLFPRSERTLGEVVLRVENLTGDANKPQQVSFELRAGEVLGLAGLNGAGKTELLRAVFGLRKVTSGTVSNQSNLQKQWRMGVGFVSEDRKLDGITLPLSIAENTTMPTRRGFLNSPKGVSDLGSTWIEKVGVACESPDQPVGSLSGGNQQKVAFARLLHADCKLLILDEPTRGVDVGSKAEIYRLIDEAAKSGAAVLLASSYLPELLGICDRIGVMNRGRLVNIFDAQSTSSEELVAECVR
jgi:ribose transport system ATP-binding protein